MSDKPLPVLISALRSPGSLGENHGYVRASKCLIDLGSYSDIETALLINEGP